MAPIATLHSSRLSAILWGVALSFDTGHATGSHSLSDGVTLPKHTDGFRGVYLGWKEEAKLLISCIGYFISQRRHMLNFPIGGRLGLSFTEGLASTSGEHKLRCNTPPFYKCSLGRSGSLWFTERALLRRCYSIMCLKKFLDPEKPRTLCCLLKTGGAGFGA